MTSPEAAPLAVEELERVAATMTKQPVSNTLLRLLATITQLTKERDGLVGKVAVLMEALKPLAHARGRIDDDRLSILVLAKDQTRANHVIADLPAAATALMERVKVLEGQVEGRDVGLKALNESADYWKARAEAAEARARTVG